MTLACNDSTLACNDIAASSPVIWAVDDAQTMFSGMFILQLVIY